MSNHLISLVYSRDLKNLSRKAVMVLLADKASDDGTGIWASKQTMADELSTSKQTVITTIKTLIEDGLLVEIGQRKNRNGYTIEYAIKAEVIRGLGIVRCHQSNNVTGQVSSPVKEDDPTSQAALPLPVKQLDPNPPRTIPEPPKQKAPRERKPEREPEIDLPDDWRPEPFSVGSKARRIIDGWSRDQLENQTERFTAHHRAKGNRFRSWQDAWKTWALNSEKFGGRSNGNFNQQPHDKRDGIAKSLHRRLAELGPEQPADEAGQLNLGDGGGSGGSAIAPAGPVR